MTDVMVYWKDYRPNAATNANEPLHWHSNSAALGDLIAGDRLWVVTSGKSLNHEQERAGFLVAVWVVERVIGPELIRFYTKRLGRSDAFNASMCAGHVPALLQHTACENGGAKAEPKAEQARCFSHDAETFRLELRRPLQGRAGCATLATVSIL